MTDINPEVVWDALIHDLDVTNVAAIVVLKPYVLATPKVLSSVLDEKLTLESYLNARLIFFRYLCAEKVATKQAALIPPSMYLKNMTLDQLAEQMEKAMLKAVQMIEKFAPMAQTILEARGLSEEDYFTKPEFIGLRGEALELYLQGELTIGGLLTYQPFAIVADKGKK